MRRESVSRGIKAELCAQDLNGPALQEWGVLFACMNMGVFRGRTCVLRTGEAFADLLCRNFYRLFGWKPERVVKGETHRLTVPAGAPYEALVARLREKAGFDSLRGQTALQAEQLTDAERRIALRVTFLGYGSLTDPQKSYHLELGFRRRSLADLTLRLLEAEEIAARAVLRGGNYRICLKDVQYISRFLAAIGAHSACLQLESLRVEKEIRNAVNRTVNCDSANLKRAVTSAHRQLQNARFLLEREGEEHLPADLLAIARLRLAHPELSLRELGECCTPPLGKSGVHHRLTRLDAWAEERRRAHDGEADLDQPTA